MLSVSCQSYVIHDIIIKYVLECLNRCTDNKYLLDYFPQFPVLWLDRELARRYLEASSGKAQNDPVIKRLVRQSKRAAQYGITNNLELSIMQENWNSFEAQRENDSILYSMNYSIEEAKGIRSFDVETIRYGNKPAIERLLIFEGNKDHIAESAARLDFLSNPLAVCSISINRYEEQWILFFKESSESFLFQHSPSILWR